MASWVDHVAARRRLSSSGVEHADDEGGDRGVAWRAACDRHGDRLGQSAGMHRVGSPSVTSTRAPRVRGWRRCARAAARCRRPPPDRWACRRCWRCAGPGRPTRSCSCGATCGQQHRRGPPACGSRPGRSWAGCPGRRAAWRDRWACRSGWPGQGQGASARAGSAGPTQRPSKHWAIAGKNCSRHVQPRRAGIAQKAIQRRLRQVPLGAGAAGHRLGHGGGHVHQEQQIDGRAFGRVGLGGAGLVGRIGRGGDVPWRAVGGRLKPDPPMPPGARCSRGIALPPVQYPSTPTGQQPDMT